MESSEWEPEYYDEDYPEWGDPEFIPGLGLSRLSGIPSPSGALARRFFPQKRRSSSGRPGPRPIAVPTPAVSPAVMDRFRELDDRQKNIASQLAQLQQRSAAQQSSEQFGPMATAAAGALAAGYRSGDMFSPFVTAGLPLLQLITASRARAVTAGFRANPWSTLGFPVAALLLIAFKEKLPGFAPVVVPSPDFIPAPDQAAKTLLVMLRPTSGTIVLFERAKGEIPPDPTKERSGAFPGTMLLRTKETLKLRAFIGDAGSTTVLLSNPF